jgi:hypothetical protein
MIGKYYSTQESTASLDYSVMVYYVECQDLPLFEKGRDDGVELIV